MIYWLHDFSLKQRFGGAQLDNEIMLKEAPLPVKMVYPGTFSRKKIKGHLLILSHTAKFKKEDLKWIMDTQKYIKYERDYAFCKRRNATGHDCSVRCAGKLRFYTPLYQKSLLNLFASPLQAGVYLKYMPLNRKKIDFIPSPIDVDRFHYKGPKEDIHLAVCANRGGWAKGVDIIKKDFPNLILLGPRHKMVPYDEIHHWFHRAKYFVHTPRWIDPCPRTVGEAFCASCELILNDNIGWLSYPWWGDRKSTYHEMRNSPKKFWGLIANYYDN